MSENISQQRIKYLEKLEKDHPDDPFYPYGLALEYMDNEPAIARKYLEKVLDKFPDYLPAYYQAAMLLAQNGETKDAFKICSKGIVLATKLNDTKTVNELKFLNDEIQDLC